MSDAYQLLRRYLEQREEIGEGPLVLEPSDRRALSAPTKREDENLSSKRSESKATEASELRPPGGIVVNAPSTDLFTEDELGSQGLDGIAATVAVCERCALSNSRTHAVPGEGAEDAALVVVGEGPGAREDETGRPFVGRAGELLTSILRAIDLEREDVFICNIVKCRPPSNRTPRQEEIEACVPYLYRQLDIVRPKVILAMGSTAISTLLQRKQSLGAFRGKVHYFREIPLVATYHPAALLRNPNWKRPTWDDVRIARRLLDE